MASAALVEQIAAGAPGAATLVGPPGAGKSTRLAASTELAAARGALVLEVEGREGVTDLAWAGVAGLVAPLVDRLDALGAPRAAALRRALAIDAADEQPIEALAVALGLLDLLAAAAEARPVLVAVDDLQWLDVESRRVLGFVAHRLGADPIGLLATARPEATAVGERVEIEPLAADAIANLLADRGVRSPVAVAAIVELAGGNPLLAERLAAGLRHEERLGSRPLPTLRVPADIVDLYAPAFEQLDARAALALAVVAADGTGDPTVLAAALAALGLALEDLEAAEVAGLVEVDGARIGFAHPLARQAAYQALPAPRRRQAHRALADAEGPDSPAGVLHRAAALVGTDATIASALAKLGADALGRGAPLTAADRFVQAAARAPEGAERAGHLVDGAAAAMAAGEPTWAAELLASARSADAIRASQLDARGVEVQVHVALGQLARAIDLADEVDRAHGADDPAGVAEVFVEVALPLLVSSPLEVAPVAERMWSLACAAPGPVSASVEVLYGCVRFVAGDPTAAERHTVRWRELLESDGPVVAGPFLVRTIVLYLIYSGRRDEAMAILDEVEPPIRTSCAVGALVPVLGARSYLNYGIDLRACVAAGREALAVSEETGQTGMSPVAESTLAIAAATVGDEELTERACQRLLASGTEWAEVWVRAAMGRLHLVHDRPLDAAAQFDLLRARMGPVNTSMVSFESDEIDALVRAGRSDETAHALAALAADASRSSWSRGQHERALALLADDIDEAVVHFAAARDAMVESENLIAQGLVELEWGEWLRRAKRRAEARRHLERAMELFALVGSAGFRRRAEAELVAAGGASDRSRPTDELLSPTELHVARLAAAGETNRQIANVLFVSPRTVENHLGAVYRKLGVTGRPGLAARAATDAVLQLATGVD